VRACRRRRGWPTDRGVGIEHVTDNYSWRWIFYVNLPMGLVAILMARAFVEDPPNLARDSRSRIDYIGFGLLAVWLGTLQKQATLLAFIDTFRLFAVVALLCIPSVLLLRSAKARGPIPLR
jgi:hypothetical protein